MKCLFCKGETKPGEATVTLEPEGATVVIKRVPAEVCSTCGEPYFDAETTRRALEIAREAARAGVEFDVRRYAA